jgi:hypothetical protein
VDLVPGEWTEIKVEVSGVKARLYVHGASQPALIARREAMANEENVNQPTR